MRFNIFLCTVSSGFSRWKTFGCFQQEDLTSGHFSFLIVVNGQNERKSFDSIVIVGYHVYVDYSFQLLSVIIFGLFLIITNPKKISTNVKDARSI